jgi:hypothetical protein
MWINPFKTPKTTEKSSSSKRDSGPTTNEDATHTSSIPSSMPAVVIDKIKTQNNAFPVQYYNCPMHPNLKEAALFKDSRSHISGRWTFNNLPELGAPPFHYRPILQLMPDPSPVEQIPKNFVVKTGTCCCLLQKYVLSLILSDMATAS